MPPGYYQPKKIYKAGNRTSSELSWGQHSTAQNAEATSVQEIFKFGRYATTNIPRMAPRGGFPGCDCVLLQRPATGSG